MPVVRNDGTASSRRCRLQRGPDGGFMRLGEATRGPEATWLPLTGATGRERRPRGEKPGRRRRSVLAWLWWEPGRQARRTQRRHHAAVAAPEDRPRSMAVVDPGRELAVSVQGSVPRWTLHFGVPGAPHRVLRFTSR